MGVPTAGSPPVASQWPSFGSSFRQGRAGTYMPEGCHWRLPSFLLFPTCFQTWGTLSNGQGTGAHDVLYGVKQCAPPRTPRRRHRRRLVPWAAGQPPQKVWGGLHEIHHAAWPKRVATVACKPQRQCEQAPLVGQANGLLTCGWVVEVGVGGRCSRAPVNQGWTPDGVGGGWRSQQHSGWPAR